MNEKQRIAAENQCNALPCAHMIDGGAVWDRRSMLLMYESGCAYAEKAEEKISDLQAALAIVTSLTRCRSFRQSS